MAISSIFLSHSSKDKPFARRLAEDLRRYGVKYWLDEAEIKLADSILQKVQQGLTQSDFVGVLLSPNSVVSGWVTEELEMAMHNQISGKRIVVLPLVIERCEIPLFLKPKLYADFSDDKKYSFALEQLLERLGVPIQAVVVTSAELQELLDRVPQPKRQDFFMPGQTDEEKVAFVVDNGIDLATLEAQTPWERAKVYSALEQLIQQHRLEIFLLRGTLAGGHPDIKEGAQFVLPIVYKGSFPPELRPSQADLDSFLQSLRVGQ